MDIFKLSKSLDELIFDVMMWAIFYPYTLIRVLIWPGKMIDYVANELKKDPETEELFDQGLSPPLFLFLSIVIAWMLSPDISGLLKAQSTTAIAKAINESSMTMLTYRLALFCTFPFAGALIYEWRSPGGISRKTFRLPFYQQAYLCGPLAIVMSVATVILTQLQDKEDHHSLITMAYTILAFLAILLWYFWTQTVFFRRTLDSGRSGAAFWGFLSVALGIIFTIILDAVVGA